MRIRGAIIDGIRNRTSESRPLMKLIKEAVNFEEKYLSEYGHAPSQIEYVSHLREKGFSPLMIGTAQKSNFGNTFTLSLDQETPEDGSRLANYDSLEEMNAHSPSDQAMQNQLSEAFARELRLLPKREKDILFLYFEEKMKLREIGELFGISEGRVSQIVPILMQNPQYFRETKECLGLKNDQRHAKALRHVRECL